MPRAVRGMLVAILCVRPVERVRVASRTLESAQRFVARMRPKVRCALEAVESAEAAVRGADIVVTATTAPSWPPTSSWRASPCRAASIPCPTSSTPWTASSGSMTTATWSAATVFVDRRESVECEAADYQRALAEGAIGTGHIRAEIGEVLLGRAPGRTSPDEITLFRSLGLAVEDVAAAQYILRRAQASGTGTMVDF